MVPPGRGAAVACFPRKEEVVGSIPTAQTTTTIEAMGKGTTAAKAIVRADRANEGKVTS